MRKWVKSNWDHPPHLTASASGDRRSYGTDIASCRLCVWGQTQLRSYVVAADGVSDLSISFATITP
jgi:hypothetical protein